jgi:mannose-6-phosphate isomerase-like protein (cupin superfamily)
MFDSDKKCNRKQIAMTEQIRLIAERIKELRELSNTSVTVLATELGITAEILQQYESGTVDIPVGFLHKVAQRYGMEFSTLLSGENPKLHVYCVVRKDKGMSVDRRKQYKYEELAANFIHKKAEPFIVRIDPVEEETPMEFNAHPGQEFNYVLEGSMKIIVDNHEILLNEGDSIYYDSGYKHAMKSATQRPVKFLAVVL